MNIKLIFKKILIVLCDLVIAGILLCIFAFFHHVLPRKGNLDNIVMIPKPSASATGFQFPVFGDETPMQTATPAATDNFSVSPGENSSAEATAEATALVTAVPTQTIAATPTATDTQRFPVQDEDSYMSENVVVNISTVQMGSGRSLVTYHVADIYIRDIECLRSAFADMTYGENFTQSVLEQDRDNNAIVAISGDSYGMGDAGVVLRNGILYKYEPTTEDICVLYYDGRMETLSFGEYTRESLVEGGAYQVWTFGPGLLDDNGKAKSSFNAGDYIMKAHPRASIGYYSPGHYVFVLVDGRQDKYSAGLDIKGLAKLYEELGCKVAYNLDGGISAVMTFNDEIYSHPARTREVTDIIYIGEKL